MSGDKQRDSTFGNWLRRWRRHRGLSQMELALQAGVSTRHLSFLETGRARPSREMVLRLGQALALPLRDRNNLFFVAGYALPYRESSLDSQELAHVSAGLDYLLRMHEPYPAFIVDRHWNIVRGNRTHHAMLPWLLGGREPPQPVNALGLLLDPELLRPLIPNWTAAAQTVWRRLDAQLQGPAPDPGLLHLREKLRALPGVATAVDAPGKPEPSELLVPLDFEIQGLRLSWFTTLAVFGAPLDITLQELVIECLFPADAATERFVRQFASVGEPQMGPR
jgi:transcriptional regulator with XRE-family HTH domain